ncbi:MULTISPECIES: cupredoxin domain-containing protein [unclassified Haladaptatus]|uniref:cupredoxin domain-containing protein n=1 Tax=unclassified Haladaptatus TaxID=2622732 RepID=UPI0023E82F70|nr:MULTISPECIES: cupredoxin domain-containing protein [unclassified Haladaptatus]
MASTKAASTGVLRGELGTADRRTFLKATGGLAVVALAGCTGGTGATADTEVDVTLNDFDIILSDDSVEAGRIQFNITNDGPSVHEFVVLRTEIPAAELPTDENGDVDEAGAPGIELVDEVEDLETGDTATLTVDMEAGHYALICNLPAHYRLGMFTDFDVR